MRPTLLTPLRLLVPALLIVASFAGCGDDRPNTDSSSMSSSVDQVRVDIDSTQAQTDSALAALDRLQKAQNDTDLKPFYQDFADAVDKADERSKALKSRADELETRKETYLADWDRQLGTVSDPSLKSQGQDREQALRTSFNKAIDALHEAQNKVDPLIGDLKDIRKALGYDLTSPGVAGVSKPVDTAKSQSSDADSALKQARKELDKVSGELNNDQGHA